ncbi:MAG: ABC transporter permease [Bacteroidetes bacterium]|jgi:putative ABC transport system permease protein|nr:ABC transporter permease [Bacteroidota bacterium]
MDALFAAITQGLAYAALAIGIFLTLKIFNIPDITTDGSYTLGGAVTAVAISAHVPLVWVFPLAFAAGALAGVATGIIHTRLKIHPLLAGILVMIALYSINLFIMGRSNIPLTNLPSFFSNSSVMNFIKAFLFALVLLVLIILLLKTDFGIAMRATGSSESMVLAMGVNIEKMKITGLALANALTALSGSLMVQYQGFADINMGVGIVISGLAAVILGESFVRLTKKASLMVNIIMAVAGSVVFRVLLALALLAGLPPQALKLVTALIVLSIIAALKISFREKT